MKHTLSHCEEIFGDHLIVSYFFNARGTSLEKTPLGMMRSIVYQLLDKDDTHYNLFVPQFRERQRICGTGNVEWEYSTLKEFMRSITGKRQTRPLLVLLDALDECNEDEIREVAKWLESCSTNALHAGVMLRVCLSSRHYPNVSIKKSLQLTVENNAAHEADIAKYIGEELIIRHNYLEGRIKRKAGGIFMWVVLVVSQLNEAYDEGQLSSMEKTLEEVPDDLEELFDALLSKDNESKAQTTVMLQLVLFQKIPLKPEDLFFATLAKREIEYALPWDVMQITMQFIKNRITTVSRGLIEAREEKSGRRYVQFIHLSVNDFLLRNNRLQRLDPALRPDPISASHAQLWALCRSYIEISWQTAGMSMTRECISELSCYPFMVYAAWSVITHAEKARSGSFGDKSEWWHKDIDEWLFDPSWVTLCRNFNYFTEGHDTGPWEDVQTDVELLFMLSKFDCPHLTKAFLLKRRVVIDAESRSGTNALYVASSLGHLKTVRLLLDNGANVHKRFGSSGTALDSALRNNKVEVVRCLAGALTDARESTVENVLRFACITYDLEIIKHLLEIGADMNTSLDLGARALRIACDLGDREIAKALLERGANVNETNWRGETALQIASDEGHQDIVELLLEYIARDDEQRKKNASIKCALSFILSNPQD